MQIKLSHWKRVNPLIYAFVLAFATEVAVYHYWPHTQFVGVIALATFVLSFGAIFSVKALLHHLGKNVPGKKFVAEVLVMHWRGETCRFWGVYRYEWVANFAARYLAYVLDHLGDVHYEFGICFRVHNQEERKASEANSDPDAENPQPA